MVSEPVKSKVLCDIIHTPPYQMMIEYPERFSGSSNLIQSIDQNTMKFGSGQNAKRRHLIETKMTKGTPRIFGVPLKAHYGHCPHTYDSATAIIRFRVSSISNSTDDCPDSAQEWR